MNIKIKDSKLQNISSSTNYDVVEGNYDVGESLWNYLVCTKNKYLDRNQHTRDYLSAHLIKAYYKIVRQGKITILHR